MDIIEHSTKLYSFLNSKYISKPFLWGAMLSKWFEKALGKNWAQVSGKKVPDQITANSAMSVSPPNGFKQDKKAQRENNLKT